MFIYATHIGFTSLFVHHLIPVFVFATYLVIITVLHHTEMYVRDDSLYFFKDLLCDCRNVPWYIDSEWNYVKGQLSTVDRHYGYIHSIIHSIGTHQIHHLFPRIPHYHLGIYVLLMILLLFLHVHCL